MSEHIGAEEAQAIFDAATKYAPVPWDSPRVPSHQMPSGDYCFRTVYDADGSGVASELTDEVAELVAAAPRLAAEVVRLRRELDAVRELFDGGPATSCRTTWRRTYQGGGTFKVSSPPVECVEVPLDDLRAVLGGGE